MTLKMSDIAKLAGVSNSAVSLTLNGKPGVSPETRKKIFDVIEKEGYKPLRKRRKGGIRKVASLNIIIVSDKSGVVNRNYRTLPFFNNLVSILVQTISSYGSRVEVNTLACENLEHNLSILLKESPITNAIILGTDLKSFDVELINNSIKNTVFVDTYYKKIDSDFVTMDNFQGAYDAANLLINHGYKDIGYVAMNKITSNFNQRRRGFYQALKNHHLDISLNHFYVLEPTQLIPSGDLPQFEKGPLPRALFCEDDYMALRVLKEFSKKGISVPNDVAIVGFDDIYEGQLITPSLSTVHVPMNQIVNQVIYQIQGQAADPNWKHQKTLISTQVISRESI